MNDRPEFREGDRVGASVSTIIRSKPYYKGVSRELESPQRSPKLTYTEGATVVADGIDLDPDKNCGQGVNFCRSIAEALQWGPVVVEITVPDKVKIVDTGSKLRAKKVVVGKVVNLSWANLSGANLSGANLSGANLSGADLTGARGNEHTILPEGYRVNDDGYIVKENQ